MKISKVNSRIPMLELDSLSSGQDIRALEEKLSFILEDNTFVIINYNTLRAISSMGANGAVNCYEDCFGTRLDLLTSKKVPVIVWNKSALTARFSINLSSDYPNFETVEEAFSFIEELIQKRPTRIELD